MGGDGVAVLEWADKIEDAFTNRYLRIDIQDGESDDERRFSLTWMG